MTDRIPGLDPESATPEQAAAIEAELAARGRMTRLKWVQAHSPEVLRIYGEWFTLRARLLPVLGATAINRFCLAVAEAQRAEIPTGYFLRALSDAGIDPRETPAEETESLLVAFGRHLGDAAGRVPDAIWNPLAARLGPVAMVDLAGFAG